MGKNIEEKLLKDGYVKENACIHIAECDKSSEYGWRRLSYEICDCNCVSELNRFANEVNKRFPNIKMFVTGGGYVKPEDTELSKID